MHVARSETLNRLDQISPGTNAALDLGTSFEPQNTSVRTDDDAQAPH
jgi:hypothetical protein